MKPVRLLAVLLSFLFSACQAHTPAAVTIIDKEKVITLQTNERDPLALLDQAGITLSPNDRLLLNGLPIPLDQPITNYSITTNPITLQVRRAITLTFTTPDGEKQIQSSAFTIGEALESGPIWLRAGDRVQPPLHSPISQSPTLAPGAHPLAPYARTGVPRTQVPGSAGVTIYQLPSHELTVTAGGKTIKLPSSSATVGEALAEAGIPVVGLDYSVPAENEPIPSDGQIRLVHVTESLQLAQKPIPFESELQASADVPLDQTQILQPGEPGLTVQRIRIRYEDGKEVSRLAEEETLVRPPKTRILAYGTKIEVKTTTVDGVSIEYWRAVQMYATSYSPCRSGTEECHSGTASGKRLRKGMVGLRYSWYLSMQGQRLYIPGYGFASVEDVCGGCVGKPWIDLGFSDENFEPWHSWVTVYFLTPVPPNVIHVLE